MVENIILGIDTSNYTTSVAVMTTEGELLANIKRPLPVKEGEKGLRQSDALFAHIKNLPDAFAEARKVIGDSKVAVIGVSERPRNIEGSYMPCFLAGVNAAVSASVASGVPLYKFSHQCGHVMAAVYSSGNIKLLNEEFAAFHISGGTTELLKVKFDGEGFVCDHIGGTRDLNAGQIIDRIGVHMGLKFPCGPEIERLALANGARVPSRKISSDGLWLNLSGLENIAVKMYDETQDKNATSAFVLDYIGRAITYLSERFISEYGDTHFVYAGGVMCNSIIRAMLEKKFKCSFAEPAMSADNAVGIAYLAKLAYEKGKKTE